jgi:hypothetical protein
MHLRSIILPPHFAEWLDSNASSFPSTKDLIGILFLDYELLPTFICSFFGLGQLFA